MIKQFINVLKSSAKFHTNRIEDGKKKRILVRRALISILLFEIGLSYKTTAQLLGCGTSTIGADIFFLNDAEVVLLSEKILAHVKKKLEIITI